MQEYKPSNLKKMRLDDMVPVIVTILLIGIVLGLGIFIMAEVRTNVATDYTGTDNDVNVTATDPTNTTTLSDASEDDYELDSITVVNRTGTTVPTTNYSYTDAGVITWSDDAVAGNEIIPFGETVNVTSTYTYDATDSPEAGIGDAMDGLLDFSGWIAVIVVVLAAAIVLGIVLKSFGRGVAA